MVSTPSQSFLDRNEFLIRRLHSLTGLVPVGAFMVVHLMANASVLESPGAFQRNVYSIHSLGGLLPVVEWLFIFLPILFHAIFGVIIIRGGLPNQGAYPLAGNYRYTLQRITGLVAFAFIAWHVFHMHGWFHSSWWRDNVAQPLLGSQFSPYQAASTSGAALQASVVVQILYAIGVLACVYHLANGIWTMGITWGVWISPAAQFRATIACGFFGIGLAAVGLGALWGMRSVDIEEARQIETRMFQAKIAAGELEDNEQTREKLGHDQAADEPGDSVEQLDVKIRQRGVRQLPPTALVKPIAGMDGQ